MAANPLQSRPVSRIAGTVRVPGDKSMSHRALMFGALAVGETHITGLLEGEDVLGTADAMRAFGARITRSDDGTWTVIGCGLGGLAEPDRVLDLGNSGTSARLLMGVAAGHPFTTFFSGDGSLVKRPMGRVAEPIALMGAQVVARSGMRFPLAVIGARDPLPFTYRMPVASAQVKSAILLAGLTAPGVTTAIETMPTRDHTERMLSHFGASVTTEQGDDGAYAVSVTGQPELSGGPVAIPSDPSSAAFPIVAALLANEGETLVTGVGMNPRRTGLIDTLLDMGADLTIENRREDAGEPIADLRVRPSRLKGIDVPPERAPSMIDEYPVLAMAASLAEGTTRMLGVAELRVKESDRIQLVAEGLAACGVSVEATEDTLCVTGTGRPPAGGARVRTALDHRIAMSFLVLGTATTSPVAVDDARPIETSFPGFATLMNTLGAAIEPI